VTGLSRRTRWGHEGWEKITSKKGFTRSSGRREHEGRGGGFRSILTQHRVVAFKTVTQEGPAGCERTNGEVAAEDPLDTNIVSEKAHLGRAQKAISRLGLLLASKKKTTILSSSHRTRTKNGQKGPSLSKFTRFRRSHKKERRNGRPIKYPTRLVDSKVHREK